MLKSPILKQQALLQETEEENEKEHEESEEIVTDKGLPNNVEHLSENTNVKQASLDILALSGSVSVINYLQIAGTFANIYMLSRLGEDVLAATSTIESALVFVALFDISIDQPVFNLISNELGRKYKKEESSQYSEVSGLLASTSYPINTIVQQGWLLSIIATVPQFAVLWAFKPVMHFFGQPPEVIEIVGHFVIPYSFSLIPQALLKTNTNLIIAANKTKFLMAFNLLSVLSGIGVNYLFIFGAPGFPKQGVKGYGYGTTAQALLSLIGCYLYFLKNQEMRNFQLFNLNKNHAVEVSKIIIQKAAAVLGWNVISSITGFGVNLMIGSLGVTALAIDQAATQYLTWTSGISQGIVKATQNKVSLFRGKGQSKMANFYGNVGLVLSALIYVIPAALMLTIPVQMASGYMPASAQKHEATIRWTFGILVFATMASTLRDTASAGLYGLDMFFWPNIIKIALTALLVAPISPTLGFVADLGLIGIDAGLAIGATVTAAVMFAIWIAQNKKISSQRYVILNQDTTEKPNEDEGNHNNTTYNSMDSTETASLFERSISKARLKFHSSPFITFKTPKTPKTAQNNASKERIVDASNTDGTLDITTHSFSNVPI